MKYIFTLLLMFSVSINAQIDAVNQGNPIEATKVNELIGEINALRNELNVVKTKIVPIGSVISMAGSCPNGYREANGDVLLRDDFSELFAIIGTAHGSSAANNFFLPDYRGRFLRGVSGTSTLDPDRDSRTTMATGGASGNNVGSVQVDQFKSHRHNTGNGGQRTGHVGSEICVENTHSNYTGYTGYEGGNETRPQNAYVRYCIKTN